MEAAAQEQKSILQQWKTSVSELGATKCARYIQIDEQKWEAETSEVKEGSRQVLCTIKF